MLIVPAQRACFLHAAINAFACLQIRVSADTQEHDLGFKLRQAQDFVEKNFRVKLEVKFTRWRSTDGTTKLRELVDRCSEWSTVTAPQVLPVLLKNVYMLLGAGPRTCVGLIVKVHTTHQGPQDRPSGTGLWSAERSL